MRMKPKGSKKLKKVSWASEEFLHQMKLFSSEEAPAMVGLNFRADRQSKPSIGGTEKSNDDLPQCNSSLGFQPSWLRAQIPWKRPPQFVLSHTWQVVSGEESQEVKEQKSREWKVFEAIYPRISDIPSSPYISSEVKKEYYDDTQTPHLSLIPIEEVEHIDTSETTTTTSQPPKNVSSDIASFALAEALRTRNDNGNLIDTDLLIKILSNKNMIQNLLVNGLPPVSEPRIVNPIVPNSGNPRPTVSFPGLPNGNSFMAPNQVRPVVNGASFVQPPNTANTTVPFLPLKDVNYYKDLIRLHGEDKTENGQNYHNHHEFKQVHNFKPVDQKIKKSKPCMYFKSSRGCLKGGNCPFQHDVSVQWRGSDVVMENLNSAKRMKLSTEVN